MLEKLLALLLALATTSAQTPPKEPAPPTPSGEDASPSVNGTTPLPALPDLPYAVGTTYEYTWLVQGQPFATTLLRFEKSGGAPQEKEARTAGTPNSGASDPATIALVGDLVYDRDRRVLTARTRLEFPEGSPHSPTRYERDSEEHGNQGQVLEERVRTRFHDGKAITTSDDGSGELEATSEELPPPVWILDRDSPEHWALLTPYLDKIVKGGTLRLYAPTTRTASKYRVRFDREEGEGDDLRRRWTISGPALNGKIWTDAEGRFLEYAQEKIQILRTAVRK